MRIDLNYAVEDAVAIVTLDNEARRNALSLSGLRDLSETLMRLEQNTRVRALMISGAGNRAFCAGADINDWGDMTPFAFGQDWITLGHRLFDHLARLPVPTIAAINGDAFGGGMELAAVCDIRVAARQVQFALPETSIGVTPGWSGVQRMQRLIPEPLLREMALTGARLSAERLYQVGFLNELAEDPRARALEIAERVAALAPRAVTITKHVLNAAAGEGREAAIDVLAGSLAASTRDKAEGIAAFRAKRRPLFTGA